MLQNRQNSLQNLVSEYSEISKNVRTKKSTKYFFNILWTQKNANWKRLFYLYVHKTHIKKIVFLICRLKLFLIKNIEFYFYTKLSQNNFELSKMCPFEPFIYHTLKPVHITTWSVTVSPKADSRQYFPRKWELLMLKIINTEFSVVSLVTFQGMSIGVALWR